MYNTGDLDKYWGVLSVEENMRVNRPKYTDRGNCIMKNFIEEVFTKYYQGNR